MYCSGDNFARAVRETMPDKLIQPATGARLTSAPRRPMDGVMQRLVLAAFVGDILVGAAGCCCGPRRGSQSAAPPS
jgi:hypothetical protein